MTYKDIEKFARENNDLACAIADFNCGSVSCDKCVFKVDVQETRCLSQTLSAIMYIKDSNGNIWR